MGGLTGAFDVDGISFAGFTPTQMLMIKKQLNNLRNLVIYFKSIMKFVLKNGIKK